MGALLTRGRAQVARHGWSRCLHEATICAYIEGEDSGWGESHARKQLRAWESRLDEHPVLGTYPEARNEFYASIWLRLLLWRKCTRWIGAAVVIFMGVHASGNPWLRTLACAALVSALIWFTRVPRKMRREIRDAPWQGPHLGKWVRRRGESLPAGILQEERVLGELIWGRESSNVAEIMLALAPRFTGTVGELRHAAREISRTTL